MCIDSMLVGVQVDESANFKEPLSLAVTSCGSW